MYSRVFGEWVFPANSDRKAMLNLIELSGVEFTIHDLCRTFITTAESLDISAYALKRLLNHKMNNDKASGYLIIDVERLRKPMQQITDYLLKCMGIREKAVVFFKSKRCRNIKIKGGGTNCTPPLID